MEAQEGVVLGCGVAGWVEQEDEAGGVEKVGWKRGGAKGFLKL